MHQHKILVPHLHPKLHRYLHSDPCLSSRHHTMVRLRTSGGQGKIFANRHRRLCSLRGLHRLFQNLLRPVQEHKRLQYQQRSRQWRPLDQSHHRRLPKLHAHSSHRLCPVSKRASQSEDHPTHPRKFLLDLRRFEVRNELQCHPQRLQLVSGRLPHLRPRLQFHRDPRYLCGLHHQSSDQSGIRPVNLHRHLPCRMPIADSLLLLLRHQVPQMPDTAGTKLRRTSWRRLLQPLPADQGHTHLVPLLRCRPLEYRQHRKQIAHHRLVHVLLAPYVLLQTLLEVRLGISGERLVSARPSCQPSGTRPEKRRIKVAARSRPHHSRLINKAKWSKTIQYHLHPPLLSPGPSEAGHLSGKTPCRSQTTKRLISPKSSWMT